MLVLITTSSLLDLLSYVLRWTLFHLHIFSLALPSLLFQPNWACPLDISSCLHVSSVPHAPLAASAYRNLTVHLGTTWQTQTDLPDKWYREHSLNASYKIRTHAKYDSKGKFPLPAWKTFLKQEIWCSLKLIFLIISTFRAKAIKTNPSLCSAHGFNESPLNWGPAPFLTKREEWAPFPGSTLLPGCRIRGSHQAWALASSGERLKVPMPRPSSRSVTSDYLTPWASCYINR